MRQPNSPRRDPGKRPPPPEGQHMRQRRDKAPPRPAPERQPARPIDYLIVRKSRGFEDVGHLQWQCEHTVDTATAIGHEPLFGVSGWIVPEPPGGFTEGYSRVSALQSYGFQVVLTPDLGGGRRGHVTILLRDPVDEEQATDLNEAFGRHRR